MNDAGTEISAPTLRVVRMANAVLAGLGSICSLFLLYAAARHSSYFSGAGRIAFYYVVPTLLAAALFLSLRLRPDRRVQLALLGVASLSGLVLLELVAAWSETTSIRRAARRHGLAFDSRSMLEFVRDQNAQGIRAVPSIFPAELVRRDLADPSAASQRAVLPLGGVALRPTVLCNELGPYVVYDSDEHGFNNPRGAWDERVEVLALGDSFVHGRCVAPDKNLAALIRARHPHTLNLAMSGNGPLLELATLREFAPPLRPATVLWFYCEGNDLTMDLFVEQRHPMLLRYLADPSFRQHLVTRQAESDEQLARVLSSAESQAALAGPRFTWQLMRFLKVEHLRATAGLAFGRADPDFDLFAHVLGEARRTVDSWNGSLWLVYLPGPASFPRFGLAPKDHQRDEVLAIAGRAGVPVVDVQPVFAADGVDRDFAGTGHYSEQGYRKVADAVLAAISASPREQR
jgi:hypothetical protein